MTRPDGAPERPAAERSGAAAARLEAYPWPAVLTAALARLRDGGHAAYLVGGTVRDVVLGRPPGGAFDVATDLVPLEVVGRFPRVEPLGLKHGTVLLVLEGALVECTTFRREGAYPDARHPESVTFTRDVREDLARRDFTMNALAWDPESRILLDPHGGLRDLERRVLRAVGDPVARFQEDALRPLRAARLAATLELEVEPATRAALGSAVGRAGLLAVERVRDELEKLLEAPRPSEGLELLREASLLELWMPELLAGYGVVQNRWHAFDVYTHALRTCDAAPAAKPHVRWAALLHDLGKPATRVKRDGEGTFYGHERVGAELADRLLARLRFPAADRERIVHLIAEHMFDYRPEWTDAAVRRWLRRVGPDAVADLFDLRIADALGKAPESGFPAGLEAFRKRVERELKAARALSVRDLAVDGGDVMRVLGIGPGPEVGHTLEALLDLVLERPETNTRERLLARLADRRETRAP